MDPKTSNTMFTGGIPINEEIKWNPLKGFGWLFSRKILTTIGVVLLLGGLGGGVYLSQHQQNIQQNAAANYNPPDGQGVYDACGPTCLDHLDLFSHAGFKLVMDYSIWTPTTTISQIAAYAQRAQQDNIKIIWSLKDMYADSKWSTFASYPSLTATCNCTDKIGLAKYLVNQVKNFPATWGYYIADEPKSTDYTAVANLTNAVRSVDPSHPLLLIKSDALFSGSTAYIASGLGQFAPVADVLGEDYYPVSYGQNILSTGSIAAAVQSLVNSRGKTGAMVLEVNSGNGADGIHATAYPSLTQMEEMLTLTLQNSQPRLVLWYWYPGTSSTQWNNLVNASAYPLQGQISYLQCSKTVGCPMNYPYFQVVTVIKSPGATGGYTYTCTNPVLAAVGECQYTSNAPCTGHGSVSANYPQCGQTVGCPMNFAKGVVVSVYKCSDGTYDCPASKASIVPGSCGVPAPTAVLQPTTTQTIAPTAIPTSVIVLPTPTVNPTTTVTPTISPSGSPTPTPVLSPTPSPTPNPSGAPLVGDLNNDGKIDILDYNLLVNCYGGSPTGVCVSSDINKDGVIDGIDYNIFLRAFIQANP